MKTPKNIKAHRAGFGRFITALPYRDKPLNREQWMHRLGFVRLRHVFLSILRARLPLSAGKIAESWGGVCTKSIYRDIADLRDFCGMPIVSVNGTSAYRAGYLYDRTKPVCCPFCEQPYPAHRIPEGPSDASPLVRLRPPLKTEQ